MKGKCAWVLKPASLGVTAEYCGKKTNYHIVKDDDDYKRREYDPFCPKHMRKAAEQGDDE